MAPPLMSSPALHPRRYTPHYCILFLINPQFLLMGKDIPSFQVGFPNFRFIEDEIPNEHICQCWQTEPERFTMNPYHHTLGLNI